MLNYRDEDIQILTNKCTTLPDDVQNEEGTQNENLSADIGAVDITIHSKNL